MPAQQIVESCTSLIDRGGQSQKDRAESYFARGDAYPAGGHVIDYDKAIADFGEYIRLRPDAWLGYSMRGDAYRLKKDYDRAIADYSKGIRLDADCTACYEKRALAYEAKGDVARASADRNNEQKARARLAKKYPSLFGQKSDRSPDPKDFFRPLR